MCEVIVVDAGKSQSTCLGRDSYIHDHCLDNLITMLNYVNCSTVICSPTVEILMLLREATSETYGARVYSHHINLHHFIICFVFTLLFYFSLCIYLSKIPKILSLSDLTLVSDREGLDNP